MRYLKPILLLTLAMGLIWNCESTDSDTSADIENELLRLLENDDSTFAIEGMEDAIELDFLLGRDLTVDVLNKTEYAVDRFDSLYIWRFGRSGMNVDRDITVEAQGDTSGIATIVHNITGNFHARQFQRVWTSDSTWERGDSIQFSVKPIEMTVVRQVEFRERQFPGRRHWMVTAFTPAYGSSVSSQIDLVRMEWIAEDSLITLDDFENTFIQVPVGLTFAIEGVNEIRLYLTSDVDGENEAVMGKWHHHPRLQGPRFRHRIRFNYLETNADNEKVYSKEVPTPDAPNRRMSGFIEVVDHRTLFDHDYVQYDASSLGVNYWLRRHVHRPQP